MRPERGAASAGLAPVLAAALLLCPSAPARADIDGTVIDATSSEPIAGALVRIQARPDIPAVTTDANGAFLLPLEGDEFPDGIPEIAAAVAYDHNAAVNYHTEAMQVFDGSTVQIVLPRLATTDRVDYEPPSATSCFGCHGQYYQQWSASRHAGAATNPWVRDLFSGDGTAGGGAGYVFRDTHDPGDTGFCATCHAPLEDAFTPGQLMFDEIATDPGLDGVACLGCHQLAHVNDDVDALHHLGNGTYRFPDGSRDTLWHVWGPLSDVSTAVMQNTWSPQFEDPKFCASCHQYDNPDTGAPGQATYEEWLASPYAAPGPGHRTCQNCHMPEQQDTQQIAIGGPMRPGSQRHSHAFVGATPQTLPANIHLRLDVRREGDELLVVAEVENQCGHNFPTGISIRNALLVLDVRIDGAPLPQAAGDTVPWWADDDVPGKQEGDHAGAPGRGFAKLLQGRINGQGTVQSPVLFIDAETVASDTGIPSGATDTSSYRFTLPADAIGKTVDVNARLLYRRAWRAMAVTKGWTETPSGMPVEIEVHNLQQQHLLSPDPVFRNGFEGP